jgi:phage/plasmid-associated DNA primase
MRRPVSRSHKPQVQGQDEGIWRRLRLIPWTVTIPEHEGDSAPCHASLFALVVLHMAEAHPEQVEAMGASPEDTIREARAILTSGGRRT